MLEGEPPDHQQSLSQSLVKKKLCSSITQHNTYESNVECNRERHCADTILAQCRFHALAISNAKILIHFSNKIYGSNFTKQHSETVMVCNYQNADCSLRKKIIASFIIIFGTLSLPVSVP